MKELFIVRHGETELNRLNTIQGRGENPPLNDTGRKQALQLYNYYKDEGFEYIFTSSLQRTHQTVEHFINTGIPWQQTPLLDEISWGVLEGKPSSHEVREKFHALLTKWQEGDFDARTEGGESPNEMMQKDLEFIKLYRSMPQNKFLICSHGRAMRILLSVMLGKPLHDMDQFHHKNTSVYKLTDNGKYFSLILHNSLEHLNAEV